MNRFNEELHDTANHQPVSFTGVDTVIRTAKHRSRRRAIATSVGTVGAVTAVTVIGVSQLSRPADPTEPVAKPPAATGDEYPPPVPASTTPAVPSGTAPATLPSGGPVYPEIPGAVDATAAEPMINWRQVDADSPEALTLKFDPSQRYAVSTGEAASVNLYENVEGSWQLRAENVLPRGLRGVEITDGKVYAVGTLEANRPALAEYHPDTGRLSTTDLPSEAVPYESDRVDSFWNISTSPIADGLLLAVEHHRVSVAQDLVDEMFGPTADLHEWNGDKGSVVTDCAGPISPVATMAPTGSDPAATGPLGSVPVEERCDVTEVTADDLGLSPDDVAALQQGRRQLLYKYTDAGFEPVPLPVDNVESAHLRDGLLSIWTGETGLAYAVANDGSLTEVFGDQAGVRNEPGVNGDRAVYATGPYLGVQTVGDPASIIADLRPLIGTDVQEPVLDLYQADTTRDVTVAVGAHHYYPADAPDEAVSVEDSGFELRYTPGGGIEVLDAATGQPPAFSYELATESGQVELYKPGGQWFGTTVPATVAPATAIPEEALAQSELVARFPIDPAEIRPYTWQYEDVLVSTVDGTSVAIEEISELVEHDADERLNFRGIQAIGDQIVVTVGLHNPSENGPGRTIYLVGTPK